MRCGLAPIDCITDHWCPVLDGRREPAGWRATCPVCRKPRALSIQAGQRTIRFNCHHAPACERVAIRAELVRLLPICLGARRGDVNNINVTAIEALALDNTLPPNALRVLILLELGWTADSIRTELKLSRQSWSDVIRNVRAFGHGRRINVRAVGRPRNTEMSEHSDSTAGHRVTERAVEQLDNNCYSDPAGRRRIGVRA